MTGAAPPRSITNGPLMPSMMRLVQAGGMQAAPTTASCTSQVHTPDQSPMVEFQFENSGRSTPVSQATTKSSSSCRCSSCWHAVASNTASGSAVSITRSVSGNQQ